MLSVVDTEAMSVWISSGGRGWMLVTAVVLVVVGGVIALERGAEPDRVGAARTGGSGSPVAASVETVALEHGVPRSVAECAAERVSLDGELGAGADPAKIEQQARSASIDCARAYTENIPPDQRLQPASSTPGQMSVEWSEFARRVDAICAVDYNKGLAAEAEIAAVADRRHWSEARTQAVMHYAWAKEQAETHDLVAALGPPPERPALLADWNANVGRRGELFGAMGDAWKRGNPTAAEHIWSRIMRLKDEANRLGRRFGLQVCTSN